MNPTTSPYFVTVGTLAHWLVWECFQILKPFLIAAAWLNVAVSWWMILTLW